MKKPIGILLVLCLSFSAAFAQNPEENAVRQCLEHYMSGQGERMEKAFHPSATMKYIDVQSKEFKDVPIAEFISRVKSNTAPRGDRKIGIVAMNVEGTAANAKIRIETDKVIMYDYMNLLKIDGEWKIVSKIFSREDKKM